MVLTSHEISQLGIVHNPKQDAWQPTTYNATVREILSEGRRISAAEFDLPPRGVVWVVSNEEFELPDTVTGLATLKTTWTHNGILALNVGIVDPGWHGPLAAALVNFSEKTFTVSKDQQFLRVAFHRHDPTGVGMTRKQMAEYIGFIQDKSGRTANTFLNMKALSREVIDDVFTLPRWLAEITKYGVAFALVAVIIALLAIFVPIAWGVSETWFKSESRIEQLEREVGALKRQIALPPPAPRVPQKPTNVTANRIG